MGATRAPERAAPAPAGRLVTGGPTGQGGGGAGPTGTGPAILTF
jgi:hypothetical protein